MSNIRVIEKEVCTSVVKMLEERLAEAKAGSLVGIVMINSWDDAATSHSWAGISNNSIRITGECFIAAHSIAQHVEESR